MSEASTSLVGLLGHPVAHSRSPRIHAAGLASLGVDARYLAFDVAPDALGAAMRGLSALGARGYNLTIPHKVAAIPHLDAIDDSARRIGAVNTVCLVGGRAEGTNTDAAGLARSLIESGVEL
ncbi:MAG: shikimate dehydrogenase, partial [Sandaracinaceae bacterium]